MFGIDLSFRKNDVRNTCSIRFIFEHALRLLFKVQGFTDRFPMPGYSGRAREKEASYLEVSNSRGGVQALEGGVWPPSRLEEHSSQSNSVH